jgi:hypothetical protein
MPSNQPSAEPSSLPSGQPSSQPTSKPSQLTFNTNTNVTAKFSGPGMTLIDAVKSGSVGLVEKFIREMGVAGDAGTNVFYTAAVSSIFDGMGTVAKTILDRTTLQLDKQGVTGNTLLIWASLFGQTGIVSELLRRGANVNVVNNDGDTAITLARKQGYSDIVTLLRTHLSSE